MSSRRMCSPDPTNPSDVTLFGKRVSKGVIMLKLKLQSFGHLTQRPDSLEKTLMLGEIEGGRRKGRKRMRWLDGIIDSMDMSLSKHQRW